MPRTKEITMTFWNGTVSEVSNIPRGQTVITRDVIRTKQKPNQELTVRRWHFDGSSEELYKGPLEHEDWRGQRGL